LRPSYFFVISVWSETACGGAVVWVADGVGDGGVDGGGADDGAGVEGAALGDGAGGAASSVEVQATTAAIANTVRPAHVIRRFMP
jgi:hypothetical protein